MHRWHFPKHPKQVLQQLVQRFITGRKGAVTDLGGVVRHIHVLLGKCETNIFRKHGWPTFCLVDELLNCTQFEPFPFRIINGAGSKDSNHGTRVEGRVSDGGSAGQAVRGLLLISSESRFS